MKIRTLATLVLLIGCVGLLQYHSIQFWGINVDAATGWAWSVLLEGSALLAWSSVVWWHRWGLGMIATLLLLAGPLYVVSEPLVSEWQTTITGTVANEQQRANLTAEIASLEASLQTFLTNSSSRAGWAGRIDQVQTALADRRADLRALITASAAPQRLTWQREAIIAMQALALVLLQGMSVLSINQLRRRVPTVKLPVEVAAEHTTETTIASNHIHAPVAAPMAELVSTTEPEHESIRPFVARRQNWLHRQA